MVRKNKIIKDVDKLPTEQEIEDYRLKMQALADEHYKARQVILEIERKGIELGYVLVDK